MVAKDDDVVFGLVWVAVSVPLDGEAAQHGDGFGNIVVTPEIMVFVGGDCCI